jgi:hypothetical protein
MNPAFSLFAFLSSKRDAGALAVSVGNNPNFKGKWSRVWAAEQIAA